MAMICVSGAHECTGCMQCQDDFDGYHKHYDFECEFCGEPLSYERIVDGHIMCKKCERTYNYEIETNQRERYEFYDL